MNDSRKWYEKSGPEGDVVLSTRVRLARNLRQYPFPGTAKPEEKQAVTKRIQKALLEGNSILAGQFRIVPIEELSECQRVSLAERHLVSPEFIAAPKGKALLLSQDEGLSIMIHQEDHLRLQVLKEGLSLKEAAETADRVETLLAEELDFAVDPELGYLTQGLTDLGTGMKASVMLHLPGLTENGAMGRFSGNLAKLGLTLRGGYGEGAQATGAVYQLSNQITLGLSEQEAIDNLGAITRQIVEEERRARNTLAASIAVQDRIDRAVGVMKTAKMLSHQEFSRLLSSVRVGYSMGLVGGLSPEDLNKLSVEVQPATLMAQAEKPLGERERDVLRAAKVRKVCAGLTIV